MDLQEMYNTAVGIIENLRTAGGNYSVSENSSVCVLVTASGRVYSGLTGTTLENGVVKTSCPEYNAIVSMMTDGERRIAKMMTVMFRNGEVVLPCEECRNIIFRMDSENCNCEIAVSKSGTIKLGVLMPNSRFPQSQQSVPVQQSVNNLTSPPTPPPVNDSKSSSDFNDFGFEMEETPKSNSVFSAPEKFKVETAGSKNSSDDFGFEKANSSSVDYVTNVTADEDNPFYEPEIKSEKSNIVRDGNIEFEMYDPNKPQRIPKPKALNQAPVSSLNSGTDSSNSEQGSYYNNTYDTGVSQYNSFSSGYTSANSEQYQSPYHQKSRNIVNSGTSSSSYYYSQMSSSVSTGDTGNSIYKQKLDNLLGTNANSSSQTTASSSSESAPAPKPEKPLSKLEMMKSAKEKKRLAKIDAKFQKKIKKKGY
ncbi:MAG: hypothetical protein SPE43_02285 [Ruminococcus sp.]|nr:hypothetical protein [Ruminococcus sp.]